VYERAHSRGRNEKHLDRVSCVKVGERWCLLGLNEKQRGGGINGVRSGRVNDMG
jgi:hypothetical protein